MVYTDLTCLAICTGIIQPICLPIDYAMNEPLERKYMVFAGWGRKQSCKSYIRVIYSTSTKDPLVLLCIFFSRPEPCATSFIIE